MIRERVVIDTVVDLRVWIARSLSSELPNRPVVAMLRVEELDERIKRVAVGALGVSAAGA